MLHIAEVGANQIVANIFVNVLFGRQAVSRSSLCVGCTFGRQLIVLYSRQFCIGWFSTQSEASLWLGLPVQHFFFLSREIESTLLQCLCREKKQKHYAFLHL